MKSIKVILRDMSTVTVAVKDSGWALMESDELNVYNDTELDIVAQFDLHHVIGWYEVREDD